MAFACKIPLTEHLVRLDELPMQTWADVSKTAGLAPGEWIQAMLAPARWPAVSVALVEACCRVKGFPVPPADYLTAKNVLDVFVEVPDEEGGDPKAPEGSTAS